MRDEEDDIAADIRAAFSDDTVTETAAEPEPEVETASAEASEGPVRDEKGRFAPKAEATTEQPLANSAEQVQSPDTAAEPASPTTRAPPYSLKAALKAKWDALPPEAQDEFLRIEQEAHKAKNEWQSKGERLNRFEELFEPVRDRLQLSGTDEFRYIQGLMKADELLRGPNAAEALAQIGQMYGISLPAGQQDPGRPQADPAIQTLQTEIADLKRQLNERATAEDQATRQQTQSQIDAFRGATNPDGSLKHLYFDNVRPLMATLMQSGQATTLEDAYEIAIHAHPEVRKLLAPPATPKPPPAPAGLSVTGAPARGSKPNGSASSGSIEDDVRAAILEASGAV